MRDIGKNIRQLRMKRNMTQDELAERLFVTRQTVSNYETGKSRPDVEMLVKISEVMDTDIHQVIYGPAAEPLNPAVRRLVTGGVLTALLAAAYLILSPIARRHYTSNFSGVGYVMAVEAVLKPLVWLCLGWTMALLVAMALKKEPLTYRWVPVARRVLIVILILWLMVSFLYVGVTIVDNWLYDNHIRGQWEEFTYEADGEIMTGRGWSPLPLPIPGWLEQLGNFVVFWFNFQYPWALFLYGGALWLCGVFDQRKK